jgi:hypothetical protein
MNKDNSIFIHSDIPRKYHGSLHNYDDIDFRECNILAAIPMQFSPFDNISIDVNNQFIYY